MRSLVVKLTLAFLLVGITGTVVVTILVRKSTRREFDQLVKTQNQQVLIANLTKYYQDHHNWFGVESVFPPGQGAVPMPYEDRRWEIRRSLFTFTDANGVIVLGGEPHDMGMILSTNDLHHGTPVEVNGETVGWLVFNPALDRWQPGTPEGDFFLGVNRAIITSAILALAIAVLLGGILAYTMTRSLRELTAATSLIAKGQLGHQVKVRTRDELGLLAASFNRMSTELARSIEARRQMTANIAHDLRTPLSVILGYTEALSDGKLIPTQEMYAVMYQESLHLSHLIEDLKVLALADAGELPLNFQPLSPGILLQRAAEAHRLKADQNQISIQTTILANIPEIKVDVDRMAQVLGNLISNALRYTPAGGEILLSTDYTDNEVRISVTDNGSGIAPEDWPYIFERSFRGDKARRQKDGETGLGLAIAKSLVETQGGRISVHSLPAKGTTFSIYFPPCS